MFGDESRPVLAPVALRAAPLPPAARLALLGGLAAGVLGAWSVLRD
jgi:hypothetical protein